MDSISEKKRNFATDLCTKMMNKIELLSPAKNLQYGIEAITHGADALYIGAPQYGARVAAANTLSDIEQLVQYAHIYNAKVYIALNTLLHDNELDDANKMIHQLYNIGVDALIIQDMGILEMDLPPIALHASTQTHNINPERIAFLDKVGFERIILGRELSLKQIGEICKNTRAEIETFVQGALCVCYSGQCYLSQSLNEHSGNRGCCSQPCRSTYNLYNETGRLLHRNTHLLSLKDFSAAVHIEEMINMGVKSFKIEGRLKDLSYVKNVTGYYRQLIDNILSGKENHSKASSGRTTLMFEPDLERTFNRSFTTYFLEERQPMASFMTQKSRGKYIGKVAKSNANSIIIRGNIPLTAGDGLCYFDPNGKLEGCLVNKVEGNKVWLNKSTEINAGTAIYRNNDFAFEKKLQNKSAERKIAVELSLTDTADGFCIQAIDEDHTMVEHNITTDKITATSPEKANEQIRKQLSKMGDTAFEATTINLNCHENYFIPAAIINDMRRCIVEKLTAQRITNATPLPFNMPQNDVPYYKPTVGYRENVINQYSERFYNRHGATVEEYGLEKTKDYRGKALMTTKYCIRYELGQCLTRHPVGENYKGNLYLENNHNKYRLQFNCKDCEMQIFLKE